MSPEQHYALKVDERTDQYSLAALSYELLTGRRPLGLFPPPSRSNPRLPREVDVAILRGLSEEPKDRFPSVREFVAALDRGLLTPRRKVRGLPLAAAAAMAVILPAAGLAWALGLGSKTGARIRSGPPQAGPAESDRAKNRPAANPVPPPPTDAAQAKPPERSPEFTRLVELRAYSIWDQSGRPTGPAGEAVKEKNWLEAERQIRDEVEARAYQIWVRQGRPAGAAGEAVREKNLRSAEAELLQETEAEMRRHPIP